MTLTIVLLIVGFVVLYYGAEFLVSGASDMTLRFGVSPVIVGLTVVAFGTSAPEFLVSLLAELRDSPAIAIGNIIGSNVANIALIVGCAAMIRPMAVEGRLFGRDYPIMMLAFALFWLFCWWGNDLTRLEAGGLLVLMVVFMTGCVRDARRQNREFRATGAHRLVKKSQIAVDLAKVGGGIAGLLLGARLLIDSATEIAGWLGVSEFVIGVTVVALGTSLPELATSVVAALRKEAAISIGNIIGSNIFNVGFIMGGVGILRPLDCPPEALRLDFPIMMGIGLLFFPLARRNFRVGRADAAFLLTAYFAYIGLIITRGLGLF